VQHVLQFFGFACNLLFYPFELSLAGTMVCQARSLSEIVALLNFPC